MICEHGEELVDEEIFLAASRLEEEITVREHKIVDLEAELDNVNREIGTFKRKANAAESRQLELEDDNKFLKSRNQALKDQVKKMRVLDNIAEKGDLELIRELNDLREKVMDLKAERNRIIDQLTDNNLIQLGDRREKEVSTEAFLNYIKTLIMTKKQLATDLMEREGEINNLVKSSLVAEQRIKQFEHDHGEFKHSLENLRQELRDTHELLEEKNLQIIALNEQASRREIEFKADL